MAAVYETNADPKALQQVVFSPICRGQSFLLLEGYVCGIRVCVNVSNDAGCVLCVVGNCKLWVAAFGSVNAPTTGLSEVA